LVKSPPELWAELSEVEGLERHLGEFGEIKITRAEPESTVAWEGENASGTVELEPTGWGTKVTITAAVGEPAQVEPEDRLEAKPDGETQAVGPDTEPVAAEPERVAAEPEPVAAEPEPVTVEPEPRQAVLEPDPGPFDPEPDPFDPEPAPEPKRRGFFTRWLFRWRREEAPATQAHRLSEFPRELEPQLPAWSAQDSHAEKDPEPVAEPGPAATADVSPATEDEDFEFDFAIRRGDEPPEAQRAPLDPIEPDRAKEVLETALENLGQAHHRPFTRE